MFSTTMTVKLKNVASELLTEEAKHIGRISHGHTSRVRERKAILTCEYISTQGMLTRELRKHSRHIGTRARKTRYYTCDVSTQSTLAHEHVSTQDVGT